MEIIDKSKAKKLETLIDEMMLSPTPNGKELLERNKEHSADIML